VECAKPVKTPFFFANPKNKGLTTGGFPPILHAMKMKIEIDINDIVTLQMALQSAKRRIDELMNDKPSWRRLYDLDKENVDNAKKVLAKIINNS
jgi:hypothetical protein